MPLSTIVSATQYGNSPTWNALLTCGHSRVITGSTEHPGRVQVWCQLCAPVNGPLGSLTHAKAEEPNA